MKRLLLFLCLVGVAVYVLTPPSSERAEDVALAPQSEADDDVRQHRALNSSWGSTLQSINEDLRGERANAQQPESPEPAVAAPGPGPDVEILVVQPTPSAEPSYQVEPSLQVDQASAPIPAGTEPAVEWVRLTTAVRARSGASVSSPGLRSYPAGSKAQVVGRTDGWVQLLDPKTGDRGWVYHAYLASTDAAPSEAVSKSLPVIVAAPASPEPTRTARPEVRPPEAVKVRRAERRRGLGLFKRRKARRAWAVGPAQ